MNYRTVAPLPQGVPGIAYYEQASTHGERYTTIEGTELPCRSQVWRVTTRVGVHPLQLIHISCLAPHRGFQINEQRLCRQAGTELLQAQLDWLSKNPQQGFIYTSDPGTPRALHIVLTFKGMIMTFLTSIYATLF